MIINTRTKPARITPGGQLPTTKNFNMEKFTVIKIEDQGDRMLLYKTDGRGPYYAIAKPGDDVRVGDEIECKPEGFNFGWFERITKAIPRK